jgi:hypothetical protein
MDSSLRFNDCYFCEPAPLAGWTPPKWPGLYAIVVSDPNWAPKAFQPLYFGEFGNNAPGNALPGNHAALVAAAKGKTLLVCACPMPFSTTAQRWSVRNELVWAYNPVCQAEASLATSGGLTHKLADSNPPSDTPGEPRREPRRHIGFIPLTY